MNYNLLSIGHFYSNACHCIFDDLTETGTIPIPLYWVLIIDFANGVGVVLIMCSLFEFVVAQAPNRMRGIMMGLMITAIGIGTLANYYSSLRYSYMLQAASPSCVFYYYLVLSLLLLLILIVFVILAKRYKLREREKHINIQAIVEEHYERYFDQEATVHERSCCQLPMQELIILVLLLHLLHLFLL